MRIEPITPAVTACDTPVIMAAMQKSWEYQKFCV